MGELWWRSCKAKHNDQLLCTEHKSMFNDHEVIKDECLCDTDECNRDIGPIVTPTTSTTTIGKKSKIGYTVYLSYKDYRDKNYLQKLQSIMFNV